LNKVIIRSFILGVWSHANIFIARIKTITSNRWNRRFSFFKWVF